MNVSLYLDVCTNSCSIGLLNDNELIKHVIIQTQNNLIDIINHHLNELFKATNLTCYDLKKIYLVNGPGSFTGVRAGLNIAKTYMCLNPNLKLFVIDTLKLLCSGHGCANLDAKGNKQYFSAYQNQKCLQPIIIINQTDLYNYINQYNLNHINGDEISHEDRFYLGINHLDLFEEICDWVEFEPYYIKGAL